MTTAERIDFAAVAASTDLRRLIESDIGPADRSRKWSCPFHDDGTPSLALSRDGRRWKCWGCSEAGDAIDWLVKRDGITVVEAAKRLDPSIGDPSRPKVRAPRPEPLAAAESNPSPIWHSAPWQAAADDLVRRAEANLWGRDGAAGLAYLRGRGLEDYTIRRFRLGYLPREGRTLPTPRPDGTERGIYHAGGIILPWCAPGSWCGASTDPEVSRWCGVQVRCLDPRDPSAPLPKGQPKNLAISGSERGHLYPEPDLLESQPITPFLLAEGEFDSLVAVQECPWMHVGTVGGAPQTPHVSALTTLALCPWVVVALDADPAGLAGAYAWHERLPHKARRMAFPADATDLNEIHLQGPGRLAEWVAEELDRMGMNRAAY